MILMVLQNRKIKVSLEYHEITKGDVDAYDLIIMQSISPYVADDESCSSCMVRSNSIDLLLYIKDELSNSCRIVKGIEDGKPYLLLYKSDKEKLMGELEDKFSIAKLDIF